MPIFKVEVKWGKTVFQDVEVNSDEEPMLFKAQLFTLTGVLPARQKVMLKGVNVRDSWTGVKLSEGATIMLMGSKEEDVPKDPIAKTLFYEDMSEAQLAMANKLFGGLTNLGNTCYLNATVQCLRQVPELREALRISTAADTLTGPRRGLNAILTVNTALKTLYSLMDTSTYPIPPIMLLQVLQMNYPRYSEKGENGNFVQQDANECWTEIIRLLQLKLPILAKEGFCNHSGTFVDQFFGGVLEVELKCLESGDEPVTTSEETFLQLSCFISHDVKYMHAGLRSKMQEQITKYSTSLDRNSQFMKTSKIKRLPAYLTIQFVRFYYKEKEAVNAKILKEVKFPMDFDAFDLCTPDLQRELTPMRLKFQEMEDQELEVQTNPSSKNERQTKVKIQKPFSFNEDYGSNNSGYYTLRAVLTHKGRSSSSGHYVAWVKEKDDCWIKCDDHILSRVAPEDVLKLCGGGDWHCAYVLLYGPRILELPQLPESS